MQMKMEVDRSSSVVSELEGTLLKDPDPFSYFMLVAFEASGLHRFALLLFAWPVIKFLEMIGREEAGLNLMIFVSVAGVRESEIKSVARPVLPKFYVDVDMEAWKVFSSRDQRIVVTKMPSVMVERFAKEHLRADEVIGCELVVNRFGLASGFVEGEIGGNYFRDKVGKKVKQPTLGLGRPGSSCSSFLSLCKETMHPPFTRTDKKDDQHLLRPLPVIFHDGRLVKPPTPSTALLILLWMPLGILLTFVRITIGLMLPMWAIPRPDLKAKRTRPLP